MTEKEPLLQLLYCPRCSGDGISNNTICATCHGDGIYAWNGTEVLFWGTKLSALEIAQRRAIDLANRVVNGLLLVFGVSGLFIAIWTIYILSAARVPITQWLSYHSLLTMVFWVSALSDCYLIFRFQREYEKIKKIPRRPYHADVQKVATISWDEALKTPRSKRIDISPYFTTEAHSAVIKSWELANKYDDAAVNPIHLLIALLSYAQIQTVFGRLGVLFNIFKKKIGNVLSKQAPHEDEPVVLSKNMREILFNAFELSYKLKQKKIEVTELLQATAMQENDVAELLYDLDIDRDKVANVVTWIRIRRQLRAQWLKFRARASLRPKNAMNRAMTAIATPMLDSFSQDLTLLARNGYLAPCIGREREVADILNILQSGNRKSVLLIGNPGVGRTTIVEGVAQRMVEEDVPSALKDKRLVNLSVAHLVSGVNPAEAQQRLLIALREIRRAGNVILFIKDIHAMVGISAGREGSIDVADVLAKALNGGSVLCIATSTPTEYKRYVEGKSSLDTVLERIDVAEVSGNEAIQILESKVGTFEYQNQVFFSYDAIEKIVELSNRFLHDRYLPEKALQILQEIAGRVREQKGKDATVTANDVATLVSQKTNIPLAQITEEESEKLLNLEARIHERMVDQEEAVRMVATSIRRARAEMRDTSRPIVNLLFLGPTGVGKTELAKTLAAVYFNAEENMIRLDMSEYQEKSSINRLIGAPPGLGSNDGGYLTEAVRKNPFSLVLLDEVEKAHPDILNVFLQVMDDGRLTDNQGRTIDFTNTIIIATSNAGTKFIQDSVRQGMAIEEIRKQLMETQLNQYYRPEFLNRFDGIVVFKPLTIVEVRQIAGLMIKKVAVELEEKGISLIASPAGLEFLATAGFDAEFGARPLRRVIQQVVQDELANLILAGSLNRRDTVTIVEGGKLSVTKAKEI